MAETNQDPQTPVVDPSTEEQTPTRLQSFVAKHPRAARIAALTGVVGTVTGAVCVTRTVAAKRSHLEEAADHAKEALSELAATVDPASPEA
jgi:hypothetical protein